MQTREPQKRVNWVFVLILIVVIPIIVFTIFMMNTLPPKVPVTSTVDSTNVNASETPDSLMPDTSVETEKDTSLKNN